MSTAANLANISRIPLELYNQGDLSVAPQVIAEDYIEHTPLPPGWPSGIPGLNQYVSILCGAFPDFHYTIDDTIAEGEKVVLRLTATGTQRGEFMGIPATGKRATWGEVHICRCAGGKLAEHWVVMDHLAMLQQLGAIPAQG
jgi:predicted ester cyclase